MEISSSASESLSQDVDMDDSAAGGDVPRLKTDPNTDEESLLESGEIVDDAAATDTTKLAEEMSNAIATLTSAPIEYSFGTFFNWFMPSSMDIWCSADSALLNSEQSGEIIIAYAARSFVFLLNVHRTSPSSSRGQPDEPSNYSIHYRDLVNVFAHTVSKKLTDLFRFNKSYNTALAFEKPRDFVAGRGTKALDGQPSPAGPRLFVGNSDGLAVVYDVQHRSSIVQDIPFVQLKSACCRRVYQSKILSAAWLHFRSLGSVVFYSFENHLIRWEVGANRAQVQHDDGQECGHAGRPIGLVQIACIASLSAESTSDRSEHKLAVGYIGGKIVIFGFDPATGQQKSIIYLSENAHSDDICSLAFSSYSIGSVASYRAGLLCSVSRDSVVKVWSCASRSEIAEYRINVQFSEKTAQQGKHSSSSSSGPDGHIPKCNWFSAVFLPRSAISQSNTQAAGSKPIGYEILITAPNGELVTITLPDKEPNMKMRIAKAAKLSSASTAARGRGASDSHQSVIFSIIVSPRLGIAITYSLDYKLLLWDFAPSSPACRSSRAIFHLFANGALSIDACLKDKRVALACGNSVYLMDFGAASPDRRNIPATTRCANAPKTWKFYQVSWNNLSDSERLGALVLGNSLGEVLYYDLNERAYLIKSGSKFHSKSGDTQKIYKLVWPVKFPIVSSKAPAPDQPQQLRTVVLSLHASGHIQVNYLPGRNVQHRPPERFMQPKFVANLPPENQLRKHSALDEFDRGRVLAVGNDDGTVDMLLALEDEAARAQGQIYRHLFRFRAFARPILSLEASSGVAGSLWLALTAMHDNFILCYRLDSDSLTDSNVNEEGGREEGGESSGGLQVRQLSTRFRLTGHQDRVAASAWSPFTPEPTPENPAPSPLLVTVSYDTTCLIWNVTAQQPLKRFYGHRSLIYTVRWSHFDPELIFTGGEDCFHVWRWRAQPDFDEKIGKFLGKSLVTADSLKAIKKGLEEGGAKKTEEVTPKPISEHHDPETSSQKSRSSQMSIASSSAASIMVSTSQVRSLFSQSNHWENNASKYDMLEDVKSIYRMITYYDNCGGDEQDGGGDLSGRLKLSDIVPDKRLARVLLYSPRPDDVRRFLSIEEETHRALGQTDAADMCAWLSDARAAIGRSVKAGEADLIMAAYAHAFSRQLYQDCVRCYWTNQCPATGGKMAITRGHRLIIAYPKEMHALSELYTQMNYRGAIDSLLDSGSHHREALTLARLSLASDQEIGRLWSAWAEHRLAQNSHEGAVKCLVAGRKLPQAIQLLEQRKTLCGDTSAKQVIEQYEDVIRLLKSGAMSPPPTPKMAAAS